LYTLYEPAGPVAVGCALGRSTGAVANCTSRRAKPEEVNDKPRRCGTV
jgi:hypothetical protein